MSGARPSVAVVTLAHGRHAHLAAQTRSLVCGSVRPDDYLVVAMGDPTITETDVDGLRRRVLHVDVANPADLPLAASRNRGFEAVIADGADVVVALDVDCLAGRDLVASYAQTARERPDTIWSGPVTYLPPPPRDGYDLSRGVPDAWDDPHPARPAPAPGTRTTPAAPELFWSLSFASSVSAWRAVGGFCEDYVGYGAEDTDFGHRAVDRGVMLGWVGGARAYHQHHPVSSPPVEHLHAILRNARIFHATWGFWPMTGWLEQFERLGLLRHVGDAWHVAEERA